MNRQSAAARSSRKARPVVPEAVDGAGDRLTAATATEIVGVPTVLATAREAPSSQTFALLDEMDRLRVAAAWLVSEIEAASGLGAGEVLTLRAVADGLRHEREIARAIGHAAAVSAAILDGLARQHLVARHPHPDAPAGAAPRIVHLTDAGRAVLEQAEAIEIRLTAALLDRLGARDTAQLRGTITTLTRAFTPNGIKPVAAGSGGVR